VVRGTKGVHLASLPKDLLFRARRVRLVLTDVDGCLTDAGVYVSEKGEELKRFSLRDGLGVERLRRHLSIETGFVTRELSGFAAARGGKLSVPIVETGALGKDEVVRRLAAARELDPSEIAFLGDDVNDLPALALVGLAACPSDAFFLVPPAVHFVAPSPGGHGAFRDLAELVLFARLGETPLDA
jgi:3-deoxy-D-manno-octulosonate 8-phosphate phosphatase (KDO 8-P phosphatase)